MLKINYKFNLVCELNITCPKIVLINQNFTCTLKLYNILNESQVLINFMDGETRILNLKNGISNFTKIYYTPSNYNISAKLLDNDLETITGINCK